LSTLNKTQHKTENLPLFFYPTKTILVDDDSLLLSILSNVLKKQIAVETFTSPKNCLNFFEQYQSPLLTKKTITSFADDEESHAKPFSLIQLANDQNRFDEIAVLVLDYSMPEMTGLQLAQALNNPTIQKLLLTGNPSNDEIIQAFNHKLINKYLNKSMENLGTVVLEYIRALQKDFFRTQTAALLHVLEADKKLPFSDPDFIAFFDIYCEEHSITEYYMADKNGSLLCINKEGQRTMLVIHTNESLESWVKLNQEECNSETQAYFDQVNAREKIPYFGINKEAWEIERSSWSNHFLPCKQLKGREDYFWGEYAFSINSSNFHSH